MTLPAPAPVLCRGGRTCTTPATHAIRVRRPGGIPGVTDGWEPLCWAHAIEDAIQVGQQDARHSIELCSIGYATGADWPLIRYVTPADGRGRYEVIEL